MSQVADAGGYLTLGAGEETFTSGTCAGSTTTREPKRHAKAKKLQVRLEHQRQKVKVARADAGRPILTV
jgi:hypothetical protein